jgi:hypothetical protein
MHGLSTLVIALLSAGVCLDSFLLGEEKNGKFLHACMPTKIGQAPYLMTFIKNQESHNNVVEKSK